MVPKRVLVVDDAIVARKFIKDILIRNGFDVCGEASNGVEAIERYKKLSPDVVTMDMIMPELDGISAVREIVAHDPEAKIIMCTSMGQLPLVIQALDAGAKSFITKPFGVRRILDAINKAIE